MVRFVDAGDRMKPIAAGVVGMSDIEADVASAELARRGSEVKVLSGLKSMTVNGHTYHTGEVIVLAC